MNAGGGFGAKIDRFAVPRVHVTADMSLSEFEAHIAGFYRTLRKRFGRPDAAVSVIAQTNPAVRGASASGSRKWRISRSALRLYRLAFTVMSLPLLCHNR